MCSCWCNLHQTLCSLKDHFRLCQKCFLILQLCSYMCMCVYVCVCVCPTYPPACLGALWVEYKASIKTPLLSISKRRGKCSVGSIFTVTITATVDSVRLLLNSQDETIKQTVLFLLTHHYFLCLIKCQVVLRRRASSHETVMGLNGCAPQANRAITTSYVCVCLRRLWPCKVVARQEAEWCCTVQGRWKFWLEMLSISRNVYKSCLCVVESQSIIMQWFLV